MQLSDPWQYHQLVHFMKTGRRRGLPASAYESSPEPETIPPWEGDEISLNRQPTKQTPTGNKSTASGSATATTSAASTTDQTRSMARVHTTTASTTTQGLTKADFAPAKVPPLEATKTTTVSGIHSEISKMMTQRRTVDENRLGLRIFLPSKKTLEFSVPFSTTVHEAITEILRLTKQRDLEELMGNADCYELRLHDDDGEIDDDFPPLERDRKIHSFGRNRVNEYVLCPLSNVLENLESSLKKMASGPGVAVLEHRLGPLKHKFQKDAIPMLRVTFNLGKNVPVPQADVPLVHEDMSTRDILEYLNAEHRLNVFQTGEILQLQLGQIDQERLRLPNCVLSLEEKIIPLGLQHAILTKKVYADSSRRKTTTSKPSDRALLSKSDSYSFDKYSRDETTMSSNATPGAGGFPLNIITASEFKEWEVTKVNRRGRRQQRFFGLDLSRVTNRKVEKKRLFSDRTRRAERLVTSISKVIVHKDSEQRSFTITYREKSHTSSIRYQALNSYQRSEIIAKLEYILALNNDSHKIQYET